MAGEPYRPGVFISYAHADEPEYPQPGEMKWLSFVREHLEPALKQGKIDIWTDRGLRGGDSWDAEIDRNLNRCDIFVLLISPKSQASDYIVRKEIQTIENRRANGDNVRFYPLVLMPTPDLGLDLVRDKNFRPRDGKPLSDYPLYERRRHMTEAANEIADLAKEIAEQKGEKPQGVSPGKPTDRDERISNVPIKPRHFIGGDALLAEVEKALAQGRPAVAALHGLSGVGKSTVAAAYAERHEADFRATWWIRAETPETTRADLVALGVRLGWTAADDKEGPAYENVRRRLREDSSKLLLIYDNAVDEQTLAPFLPSSPAANIIITSTSPVWRNVASAVRIPLWSKEDGADYLVARTEYKKERAEAEGLWSDLGGLALAYEQAAAFCERTGVSLAGYRERFAEKAAEMMAGDAPVSHKNVTTTFAVAIESAASARPAVAPLIDHAALLGSEPIPRFLFTEARDALGDRLNPHFADRLDDAIGALRAFALVECERIEDERDPSIATDTIRLHQLVSLVAAGRLGQGKVVARRRLVEAILSLYPDNLREKPQEWWRVRRLDALALNLTSTEVWPDAASELSVAELLTRLGCYRQAALADYKEAVGLLTRALRIRERILGPDHCKTVESVSNLAWVFRDASEPLAAETLFRRALDAYERTRDPNDLLIAESLDALAWLHEARHKFSDAGPLFERALRIRETTLGHDALETAKGLSNLASLLQAQGDFAAARPLFDRALSIRERALGPDDPLVAESLNSLAWLLQNMEEVSVAEEMFRRALAIRKRTLGPRHLLTGASLNNLAWLLQIKGEPTEARQLFETALDIREKSLGAEHPETAASLNNLGWLLLEQGDLDDAQERFERALEICTKKVGSKGSETAKSINNLGLLWRKRGDLAKAQDLFRRALEIREDARGGLDPETNETRSYLASIRLKLGAPLEALGLAQEALDSLLRMRGAQHPWTKVAAVVAANALDALGRAEQAAEVRAKYSPGGGPA